MPCDTGSARHVLESQPDFAKYDLSSLTPDWTSKRGFYAADPVSLDARAQWVRQFLRERPEQHIAVVAHGDFLRRLTDDPMSYWGNAEVRAFQFAPSSVATDACPIVHVEVIEKGDWNGEKVVSGTQTSRPWKRESSKCTFNLPLTSFLVQPGLLKVTDQRARRAGPYA